MKKLISVFLIAAMLVCSVPSINVFADEKEYSGSYEDKMTWEYAEETKTLKVHCDGPLDFPYEKEYYDMPEVGPVFCYKKYPWFTNGFASTVEKVELTGNITAIGDDVFYKFFNLKEINLPEGITRIGVGAFSDCDMLEKIEFPSTVKEFDSGAFDRCDRLTGVELKEGVEYIGESAFYGYALEHISLLHSIKRLGKNPFGYYFNEKLFEGDMELVNGIFYIGEYAVAHNFLNNRPTSVSFRDGTVLIPDRFFESGGSSMTSVEIPDTVKYIGEGAFNTSILESVRLPESLETLGKGALSYTRIKSVNIPKGLKRLEDYVFAYTSLEEITIPSNITYISDTALLSSQLKAVKLSSDNKYYSVSNGVLFNKDKSCLIHYPYMKAGKHYNVPETVKTINTSFSARYLETVAFPKSIKACKARTVKKIYYYGSEEEFNKISYPPQKDYTERMTVKCCKVKYSKQKYTYNKKVHTPKIKVYDATGTKLKEGRDYKITLPKGRKKIGYYTVKVKLKGKYKGSYELDYRIAPKGTKIKKVTAGVSSFKVKWSLQNKNISGYELQYSQSSTFSAVNKLVFVKKPNATSKKIKGLSVDRTYYVRIRTYKKVGKENVYSAWSKAKKVKVTKPY